MLSAASQERIIKTNNQAFEELALRWRDPQTGETEPDVKRAVQRMVCSYLSVPCYSCDRDRLYALICRLQEASAEEDGRVPIKLTEEEIPVEASKILKTSHADPDPGHWDWDDSEWDWELSLYSDKHLDWGYVALVPLKNGRRFEHEIKPASSHREWAIRFCGIDCPTIFVRGSLHQVKRRLDALMAFNTPEIQQTNDLGL
jgi:hypothetical protein